MKYENPIIKGFHPDPSICRVGDDYYLVNSSMEYFPGIPVYHSRDLVNWKQIGNCIDRSTQMQFEHASDSGGIWAPTIRYSEGIFYVTAAMEQYGSFIVHTSDPAAEWSDPVWVPVGGIDPSLYFEDGRVYYCTNQTTNPGREEITLEEIDVQTGQLKSPMTPIWSGTGGGHLEGPHIYRIDGWYYLLAAEGGTFFNHMVTIARSRSLWGEYESCPGNPVLTNRHDISKKVQCAGHGDLIQDHYGSWWMVHLGIRLARRTMSHLGRETFLTPIEWKDGWPIVRNDRMAKLEDEGPLWDEQRKIDIWAADFSSEEWENQWLFARGRKETAFKRLDGALRLYPSVCGFKTDIGRTFAAVRPLDFSCIVETVFRFKTEQEGDEAGLAVYLASDFHYRFGVRRIGQEEYLVIEKTAEDFHQTVCKIPVTEDRIRLRIECEKERYLFYYSQGNRPMELAGTASTRFLSCEVAGRCFSGTVLGIYARAEMETAAYADFEIFVLKS